jgi:hypothetical protein
MVVIEDWISCPATASASLIRHFLFLYMHDFLKAKQTIDHRQNKPNPYPFPIAMHAPANETIKNMIYVPPLEISEDAGY